MTTPSRTSVTSLSNYNLESTSSGFRLKASQLGCMRIFGVMFLLPGIFIVAALFQLIDVKTPAYGTGEWAGLFLLGLAFGGFGAAITFYRSYILIDLRTRKAIYMWGIFKVRERETFSLDNVSEMIISRTIIPNSDGPDYVAFAVIFLSKNGHNFEVGYYRKMADAIRVAVPITRRMGLKVFDATVNGRPEITAEDMNDRGTVTGDASTLSRYDFQGLSFKWDGHSESLSRLLKVNQGGISFFKIVYPKLITQRTVVTLFGVIFFVYFFGWRLDQIIPQIFSGFFDPNFLHSPEIFFTSIIGSAFVLFLLGPVLGLITIILKSAPYAILGVGNDGLYIHDPKARSMGRRYHRKSTKHLLVRYADILSIDIQTAEKKFGRQKVWKWEKSNNFIALRIGTEFYEVGNGLDRAQLEMIANEIKLHLLRNPAK